MNIKIHKTFHVLAALVGLCLPAIAAESDSASVTTLALQMMAEHPKTCLGIETVPDLKAEIRGSETINQARQNWESLGKAAEDQTDYIVEMNGDNVLIRPKNAPRVHDGPVVERPILLSSVPRDWHSIADGLRGMSYADKSKKFGPEVTATSMTYSADHPLQLNPNVESRSQTILEKVAPSKSIKLSDVLFLVAQMADARVWSYEASEGIIINGKRKIPRELTDGFISFSGPSR